MERPQKNVARKRARNSMNPVELLRLVQFLQLIARYIEEKKYQVEIEDFPVELSRLTGLFDLGSMKLERTRSIIREIAVCELCSLEERKVVVSTANLNNWQIFSESINYDVQNENQRWNRLDDFLSKKHDMYRRFAELCNKSLSYERSDLKDIMTPTFPGPTISTLLEWGFRLNRIQCNLLDGTFYPINKKFRLYGQSMERFTGSLLDSYEEEKHKSKQETVSLPIVAEKVCAKLKLDRKDFCDLLEKFHDEYHSRVWLGAGVIRTYAYEDFVVDQQSVLDVSGIGPWFARDFFYRKTDLPQYAVHSIPRRFIKIEGELKERL